MRRRSYPHMRPGPPTVSFRHSGVTVTTTSGEILSAYATRYVLVILNMGSLPVWVRLDGGTVVADKSALRLLPGERTHPLNYIPGSAVNALTDSGTCDVHITEGFGLTEESLFAVIDSLNNNIVDSSGNRIVA